MPRQVALLVRDSLKRLSEQWNDKIVKEQVAKQAAGSYTALTSASKKRRAVLLDVDMQDPAAQGSVDPATAASAPTAAIAN